MLVVELKVMPRYLNSVTVGMGWPAKRRPATSATCRAPGVVRAPLHSMTLVLAVLMVSSSCHQWCSRMSSWRCRPAGVASSVRSPRRSQPASRPRSCSLCQSRSRETLS